MSTIHNLEEVITRSFVETGILNYSPQIVSANIVCGRLCGGSREKPVYRISVKYWHISSSVTTLSATHRKQSTRMGSIWTQLSFFTFWHISLATEYLTTFGNKGYFSEVLREGKSYSFSLPISPEGKSSTCRSCRSGIRQSNLDYDSPI